jgi:hypothetical protein
MDQTAVICLIVFLFFLSFLALYDKITKTIPSRLRADQAPKSAFGLIPAFAYGEPAEAHGIE